MTYDYDEFGYPTSTTTGLGVRTEATYDSLGRVLTSVGARGARAGAVKADYTTTWTYDAAGRVLTVEKPGETKASVIVYDAGGRPVQATDTLDRVTSREYDPATGDLTATVDVKGRRTTYTYDARGRLSTVTDPLGRVTSTTYDGAGQVRTTTDALGRVTTYTYDVAGQLVRTILPNGRLVLRTYDGAGRLVSVTAAGAATTYAYDDAGRVVTSTLTAGASGATITGYDQAGRVVAVRRPDGTTVTSTYDRVGQLTDYTDAAGRVTHYAYDVDGNRTAVTDSGGRTTGTAWVDGYASTVTTADGKTIGYVYDAAGRVVGVDYSDATPDVAYTYDPAGRRVGMVDGGGATTWVYDSDDTVTAVTGPQGDLAYTYDAVGRRTGLIYPGTTGSGGPRAVTYAYDDVDRLTGVGDWAGGGYAYSWNSDDQLATLTYPNGVVTTNTYDPATTQLSRIATVKAGTTLLNLAYTYNAAQLVTGEARTGKTTSGATLSGTRAYTYDALARLRGATLTDTSTTPAVSSTRAYTFDTADQLATLGDGTAVAHDAAGQVTTLTPTTGGASTYTYDGRGNRAVTVTSGGSTVETGYDLADRLTTWTSTATAGIPAAGYTFTYAGDGLRATATTTTGTGTGAGTPDVYLWDRLLDLPTLVQDNGHQYIYGLGTTPLAQIDRATGAITYLHADALGSTRATTDTTGAVTATIDYDPYGQTLTPTTGVSGITRFLYTGQYLDPTGLYYLRARYYNPTDATFLTRDPIENTTHDPYGYVSGNPVMASDPAGLASCLWGLCDSPEFFWNEVVGAGQVFQGMATAVRHPKQAYAAAQDACRRGLDPGNEGAPVTTTGVIGCLSELTIGPIYDSFNTMLDPTCTNAERGQAAGSLITQGGLIAAPYAKGTGIPWTSLRNATANTGRRLLTRLRELDWPDDIGAIGPGVGDLKFAQKVHLNVSNPAVVNRSMTVRDFIARYRQASVLREFPGEYLDQSVAEALRAGDSTVRKLLTDGRFAR